MSLRAFALVNLIVGLAFAVALLAAPGLLLRGYGLMCDDVTALMGRLLGAAFLGLNVLTLLLLGQLGSAPVRRALVIALGLEAGSGAIVSLISKLQGMGNALLWSIPAIYGLFALGYLYFLIRLPNDTRA